MRLLCLNWHLDLGYMLLAAWLLKLLGYELWCSVGMEGMYESMCFSHDYAFTSDLYLLILLSFAPFLEVMLYSVHQFPKSFYVTSIVSRPDSDLWLRCSFVLAWPLIHVTNMDVLLLFFQYFSNKKNTKHAVFKITICWVVCA